MAMYTLGEDDHGEKKRKADMGRPYAEDEESHELWMCATDVRSAHSGSTSSLAGIESDRDDILVANGRQSMLSVRYAERASSEVEERRNTKIDGDHDHHGCASAEQTSECGSECYEALPANTQTNPKEPGLYYDCTYVIVSYMDRLLFHHTSARFSRFVSSVYGAERQPQRRLTY
jgi:hypothetical protein